MSKSYSIGNAELSVTVKSYGAELASVRTSDGIEYVWQADEKYWARHSPVLFPVVGRLLGKKYRYNGKEYSLEQHGFARDREFELIIQEPNYIEFGLKSDESSQALYPFDFDFRIGYRLDGRSVSVEYSVRNTGNAEMLFSLGAHPGFNIPLVSDERLEEYVLRLSESETAHIHLLEGPHFSGEQKLLFDGERECHLNKELFKNDALVFKGLKSETVAIAHTRSGNGIAVDCAGWPYLGIWMPPSGAPFICIEPWYGLADNLQHDGNLETKEGIMRLQPNENFFAKFTIRPLRENNQNKAG